MTTPDAPLAKYRATASVTIETTIWVDNRTPRSWAAIQTEAAEQIRRRVEQHDELIVLSMTYPNLTEEWETDQ